VRRLSHRAPQAGADPDRSNPGRTGRPRPDGAPRRSRRLSLPRRRVSRVGAREGHDPAGPGGGPAAWGMGRPRGCRPRDDADDSDDDDKRRRHPWRGV